MNRLPAGIIDLSQLAAKASMPYENVVVCHVNDHVVRLSVMTAPYFWHFHPDSDETFLVIEGMLIIELENETINLQPGQMFTVPRNITHRTRPATTRSVNLTIEHQNLSTVKVDSLSEK